MTLSFRLNRKKLAIYLIVAVVAVVGAFSWKELFEMLGNNPPMMVVDKKTSLKVEKEQDRQEFIASFGWSVEQEPNEIAELLVPSEFNQTYENYNEIQKGQGFNLAKYKGKRVKRYTYLVLNYPGKQNGIRLNLLVYNGRVIGGDVCSLELNGFIHGFTLPNM